MLELMGHELRKHEITLVKELPSGQTVQGLVKYSVRVQLNQPDPRVLLGMTANVNIVTATEANALQGRDRDKKLAEARAALAARFGAEFLRRLDQALGRAGACKHQARQGKQGQGRRQASREVGRQARTQADAQADEAIQGTEKDTGSERLE